MQDDELLRLRDRVHRQGSDIAALLHRVTDLERKVSNATAMVRKLDYEARVARDVRKAVRKDRSLQLTAAQRAGAFAVGVAIVADALHSLGWL